MPDITTHIRRYAVFLFLFFAYLVVFVFVGLWIHVAIGRWTLIAALGSYALCWLITAKLVEPPTQNAYKRLAVFVLITPLFIWGGSSLAGHTYDTSYDGLFEHEPAVLALANHWNPIYSPKLHMPDTPDGGAPFIEGSPKAIWAVEASLYKLTGTIDGSTVINLLIALVALVFTYGGLQELDIKPRLASVVTLLAVITPLLLDQLLSFRQDSLSYECLLIGLVSLIYISRHKHVNLYYCCLIAALLLLAGSKFSNIYTFGALTAVGLYVCLRKELFRVHVIRLLSAGFVVASVLVLFNPIFTNVFTFHSLVYPYNSPVHAESFRDRGVPTNIRRAGKPELFFYGVFASSEIYYANNANDYAKLKVPFTFTRQELALDALNTSKLVGGYGVLFSGLFVLSLTAYAYLCLRARQRPDIVVMRWVHVGAGLIVVTCLVITIPNYARYNSQLYLLPIVTILGLALTSVKARWTARILSVMLLVCLAGNVCLVAWPSFAEQAKSDTTINRELAILRATRKPYVAYSGTFDASYEILRTHGVPVVAANHPLRCTGELDFYFPPATPDTQLCPIQNRR